MITIQLNQREVLHLWTTLEAADLLFSAIDPEADLYSVGANSGPETVERLEAIDPDWRTKHRAARQEHAELIERFEEQAAQSKEEKDAELANSVACTRDLLAQLSAGPRLQVSEGQWEFLTGSIHGVYMEAEIIRNQGWEFYVAHCEGLARTTGVNVLDVYEPHWGDDPVQFFTERFVAFYSIIQKIEIAYEQELRETEDWRPCGPDCGCELLRDADHEPAGRGAADPAGDPPRIGAERVADRAAGG